MIRRALLPCLLTLAACPSFEVGPDVFELVEDAKTCKAARVGLEPCSRFEADNPIVHDGLGPQPLLLAFGFEASERNLDHVTLEYERPGEAPVSRSCSFGYALEGEQTAVFGCNSVGLAGAENEVEAPVVGTAKGVLEIDAWIITGQSGPHALSMWITDDNGYESPVIRWQFTAAPPVHSPDDCCAANSSPGCPDEACAEAICDDDPFCCSDRWDPLCAAAAIDADECEGAGGSCAQRR